MILPSRNSGMGTALIKTRLLFASDFHGNETVWRKFLNSAKIFDCNVLLCGGDMTGKVMVPIIRRAEGGHTATLMKKRYRINEEDLQEFKKRVRTYSYIPCECSEYAGCDIRVSRAAVR